MAIGNRAYVKKHYGTVVEQAIAHYDELIELFRERYPRSTNARDGRLHLGLETHVSRHRWAWHGVVIDRHVKRDGTIEFSWRPRSFYGYVCLEPADYMPILNNSQGV